MNRQERETQNMLGRTVTVQVDRPAGHHHGDIIYPINYGFVPGLMGGDGEEQDAYILGVEGPLESFTGRVIGVICRHDDCEDKLVVAPEGMLFHQGEIAAAVRFQEQYFTTTIHCLLRRSCGVIPYRKGEKGIEYLILHQNNSCWSFPKGHMEAGETEEQTARRELFEETGLEAVLLPGYRTELSYSFAPGLEKQVVLFPGQVEGEPVIREQEIEAFRWVSFDELADHLFPDTFETCARLLEQTGLR